MLFSPILLLKAKALGAWALSNLRIVIMVAIVAVMLFTVHSMTENYVDRGWRAKVGEMQADWASKIAVAEKKAREAEARERAKETAWRDHVAKREKEYRDDKTATAAALAAERVAGDRLRSALDNFTRAGYARSDPSAAVGDLRRRVEILGSLVSRFDAFAGECTANADACRDSLSLCRAYSLDLQVPVKQ